jgi:hypothetical protein
VHALLALPSIEGDLARLGIKAVFHSGDIAACAEPFSASTEHQCPDGLVSSDAFKRGYQFCSHVVAYGIALVGAIEYQGGDAGSNAQFDQACGHIMHLLESVWSERQACR